jgi:hypothetical protein
MQSHDGHSDLVQGYLDEINSLKLKLATAESGRSADDSAILQDELKRLGRVEEEKQKVGQGTLDHVERG